MKSRITSLVLLSLALSPLTAWSGGKPRPAPAPNVPPASQTPAPPSCQLPPSGGSGVAKLPRRVVVKPVDGVKSFQLPNGNTVDATELSGELTKMVQTAAVKTGMFVLEAPSQNPSGPCDYHLELQPSVTQIELNNSQHGIKLGYSPTGSNPNNGNFTGTATFNIGKIRMDFSFWECIGVDNCSSAVVSSATEKTKGVSLSLEIGFKDITTGYDLIWNTSLHDALSKIMDNGLGTLAADATLNELSWRAKIYQYIPETGTLIFNRGVSDKVKIGDRFVVYAAADNVLGDCALYEPVAHIHITQVETVSSFAIVEDLVGSRGIRVGDIVMIEHNPSNSEHNPK